MKKKYRISVHGCDDSTTIKKELTEDEFKLIQSVAEEVTEASEYICMPIMEIEEVDIKNERTIKEDLFDLLEMLGQKLKRS